MVHGWSLERAICENCLLRRIAFYRWPCERRGFGVPVERRRRRCFFRIPDDPELKEVLVPFYRLICVSRKRSAVALNWAVLLHHAL